MQRVNHLQRLTIAALGDVAFCGVPVLQTAGDGSASNAGLPSAHLVPLDKVADRTCNASCKDNFRANL